MKADPSSRVQTEAIVENLADLWAAKRGRMPAHKARRLILSDALVDLNETLVLLPTRLLIQLGLESFTSRMVKTRKGDDVEVPLYAPARLTIQGRSCTMDVIEVLDSVPPTIGRLPLLHLDFVVDAESRSLIGNPAHDGEHMYELY